jgi:adenylosuccinate synthase
MVIDPKTLVEEIRAFRGQGLLKNDADLIVSGRAHLTFPHHRDDGSSARESARRDWNHPTWNRPNLRKQGVANRASHRGPSAPRAPAPQHRAKPRLRRAEPFRKPVRCCRMSMSWSSEYLGYGEPKSVPSLAMPRAFSMRSIRNGKNVLFEGAHGVLLDLDHGTYPFVTSSSTTAGGACTGCGIGPDLDRRRGRYREGLHHARRAMVRSRPSCSTKTGERLREVGREYGSTTGRPRRCGWLDIPALAPDHATFRTSSRWRSPSSTFSTASMRSSSALPIVWAASCSTRCRSIPTI